VFLSEEEKPEGEFGFLLTKKVQNIEFQELSGKTLEKFIAEKSRKCGISFEQDAFDFFVLFIFSHGSDRSWRALFELEKLSLLGLSQPIQKQDLARHIKIHTHEELFSIARAIMNAKDVRLRLPILEKVFIQNNAMPYLFNLLPSFTKGAEILLLADYDVAVKSGKLGYEEAILEFILKK